MINIDISFIINFFIVFLTISLIKKIFLNKFYYFYIKNELYFLEVKNDIEKKILFYENKKEKFSIEKEKLFENTANKIKSIEKENLKINFYNLSYKEKSNIKKIEFEKKPIIDLSNEISNKIFENLKLNLKSKS